jgi:hypothetical protein
LSYKNKQQITAMRHAYLFTEKCVHQNQIIRTVYPI